MDAARGLRHLLTVPHKRSSSPQTTFLKDSPGTMRLKYHPNVVARDISVGKVGVRMMSSGAEEEIFVYESLSEGSVKVYLSGAL